MLISEMILLMLLDGCKGKIYSRGRATKDLGYRRKMVTNFITYLIFSLF